MESPAAGTLKSSTAPAAETTNGTLENGVTVVRASPGTAPHVNGPLIIKVPDALGVSEVAAADPHLIEMTHYGPLPKIGADGARPSDLYARPLVFSGTIRPGAPRIAIYIGGLGLSADATREAIGTMPAAVSLAFAPYAVHLEDDVKRAKAAGHEALLQIPMEAFGDQRDQPGPHTLRTDMPRAGMIDDLHWLMSRMTGYAGVTNFLGGKFTADQAAMTAMLQETGSRGLLYIDDGTSKRSLGALLAPQLGVPAARVDIVLDAAPDPAALRAALVKLEAIARAKGTAIGMASDLPANLGAIASFAATLEAKGIALVPITSVASTNPANVAVAP
ncbi:MAG: divergent polysaccharide deacetylase family protein [Beijerinckiaceae bacterium]|nr:divergent polysaccharide deacetylase family protein [Beijerinckiaceae bacterium]